MYTLRQIRLIEGAEERDNVQIGDEYTVYYKETDWKERGNGEFAKLLDRYFEDSPKDAEDKTNEVVGFVMAKSGKLYPFFTSDAVFIVNQDGKTFERVYGQVRKR